MMRNIRQLTIKFSNEIAPKDVVLFRGAVNAALEKEHSILFHNHTEQGFRYAYPLIQYKRLNKKAAIVCFEEGTDAIGEFFNTERCELVLGARTPMQLSVESVKTDNTVVQISDTSFVYRIKDWLPLNASNYNIYQGIETLSEKIVFLERLLIGNILSFMKGMGIFTEERVSCKIMSLGQPKLMLYKGVSLTSMNAEFKTNVSLPQYLGLGKGASTGFGIVTKITV